MPEGPPETRSLRSPTQRSSALLRERGYTVDIVEHFNAYARVRHDMFGWADLVALHPSCRGVLAVQTTTGANLTARIAKASAMASFRLWIALGNSVEFHGWRKVLKGGRGTKLRVWEPVVVRYDLNDLL